MTKQAKWALLGGNSLLGKEVRELVLELNLPVHLRYFGAKPNEAVLAAGDDEPFVMEPFVDDSLEDIAAVFLACPPKESLAALAKARRLGHSPVWIDLRGDLEDLPESRLRSPLLEAKMVAPGPGSIETIAHSGAVLLGRFFDLLHRSHPFRHAVVTALEPVSAQEQKGIDELHKQTASLFSFQSMPQEVFDIQVAFNLLPRYGSEASANLETSERRMERHLATLLAPKKIPLPSLRLIHAPVFHGYCFSVWVQFEKRPSLEALREVFTSEGVDLRTPNTEPPSNMAVAGHSGITVGEIAEDPGDARAAWFFVAGDNLRTTAENAVMVAGLAKGAKRK
jgi:aspartate-semialdehyde dehydrogenase